MSRRIEMTVGDRFADPGSFGKRSARQRIRPLFMHDGMDIPRSCARQAKVADAAHVIDRRKRCP